MEPVIPPSAVLVRLAVERVASEPEDEQRYLELNFALDRAVERDLRYRELLALFAEGAMAASLEYAWAWRLAAGLGSNLMGDSLAAVRWLEEARRDLEASGRINTAAASFVFGELARAHYHRGDHTPGLEAASRALQLARAANSLQAEAYAHHYLGLISLRRRDFAYARRHILAARERFEWMNQRHGRARVLDSLATLEMEQGQYDHVREMLEESLTVKQELRDLRGQALTCGNLARLYTSLGDYPLALRYLDQERELVQRIGDERNATVLRGRRGALHLRYGKPELACEELLGARGMARERKDPRVEAYVCFDLAEAERQTGNLVAAREAIQHAHRYFQQSDDLVMRDRAMLRLALLEGHDLDAPEIREPLERLRASGADSPLAEALFEAATFFRNQGREAEVIALYAEALDVAEPTLAAQFAALMRGRADSVEGSAWVDAMLTVKQQKDKLEQAYADLRRAESLRESLTQMIVHDLKNPLTAMMPWLETIQAGILEPEETAECLQTVIDEGQYLLRMIEDLNDVGKMQLEGKLDLLMEPTDLEPMLADVVRRMQGRAREAGMRISLVPPPELPLVRCDREKLRRVLENLAGNAVKYGRPPEGSTNPPEVTLHALVEPPTPDGRAGSIRVEVRDFGSGIPLAESDRVFEPYYQAEAGRKRKAGVGLGLAYCRMVVEAHGGVIWTEPNPAGGSVFAFRLPLQL